MGNVYKLWVRLISIALFLCFAAGCSANKDTGAGLYVPAIVLPETANGDEMLGTLVYNGGIYTSEKRYVDDELEQFEHLLGDHLGITSGSVNIGAGRNEYTEKIASNLTGNVYTVKGYDPDFMLCVRSDERIAQTDFLWVLYRLNDITLQNGENLFEDRLHIRDNIERVQWQSNEDWNFEMDNLQDISIKKSVWKKFLRELYKGEFVNTYIYDKNHPTKGFYEDKPYSSIYDTPNQVHLFLVMSDGTTVELRLIEGGYVGLQVMSWYFVKIPGETFDAVYDACCGNHEPGWVVAE